jgi:hypothetical protein
MLAYLLPGVLRAGVYALVSQQCLRGSSALLVDSSQRYLKPKYYLGNLSLKIEALFIRQYEVRQVLALSVSSNTNLIRPNKYYSSYYFGR